MSQAEAAAGAREASVSSGTGGIARRRVFALLGSELGTLFRRRRTIAMLVALAAVPVLIAIVVRVTGAGSSGRGPAFLGAITDNGLFPRGGIAWELNYRGALDFLHQAKRQQQSRGLQVEDGWIYFIHGWTQVIAEVFHVDIGEHFAELERLAMDLRGGK